MQFTRYLAKYLHRINLNRMHVHDKNMEEGTHMIVLSVVKRQNDGGINPDLNRLLEHASLFQSHLEYIIVRLLEKQYISKESNSEFYDTYDYSLTDGGRMALKDFRIQAKSLVSSIRQFYQSKLKDELLSCITSKKDSVWFAYYEGYIAKRELQDIADLLDMSIQRLWWDESFQKWMDRNWSATAPG